MGWNGVGGASDGFSAVSEPAYARAVGSNRTLTRLAIVVKVRTSAITMRLRLVLISGIESSENKRSVLPMASSTMNRGVTARRPAIRVNSRPPT